ncbi:hypothetical protein NC796_22660 [Aliifodinibius sp. S!AR15-10]|uniref:hypothetical protein n=1 Tax=Aliifodinibius sp. S!AR15-10 TaxID=2950437 RepID=UPI00285FBF76|nr:hypothetical protein [Aliifodinibius sp. S!AR15-10]MDR8393974.1 hypothetical protein [Aliifodinibius sp. S!AR15-10]
MDRKVLVRMHAGFGTLALLLILSFFTSTVVVELQGDITQIQMVKRYIVYGIGLLAPAMAVTGFTGTKLSGKSRARLIQQKKNRMKRIMMLGVAVLIPAAFLLNYLAQFNAFGMLFYSVQAVELVAGAANIFLMGLNMKEGFMLSGRIIRKQKA